MIWSVKASLSTFLVLGKYCCYFTFSTNTYHLRRCLLGINLEKKPIKSERRIWLFFRREIFYFGRASDCSGRVSRGLWYNTAESLQICKIRKPSHIDLLLTYSQCGSSSSTHRDKCTQSWRWKLPPGLRVQSELAVNYQWGLESSLSY